MNPDTISTHLSLGIEIPACNNCDLQDIHGTKQAMFCMHLNIHSLPAKFDSLKNIILTLIEQNAKLDAILICETFLMKGMPVSMKYLGISLNIETDIEEAMGAWHCIYLTNTLTD